MSVYQEIQDFINLAIDNKTIEVMDEIYLRNQLLNFLGLEDWKAPKNYFPEKNSLILMDELIKFAQAHVQFGNENAEFYETKLMDFITPKPSQINRDFWEKYKKSPQQATQYFYDLAREVNQVKTREIAKNIAFSHPTEYGNLEITINLSKPEKDPRVIAAAKAVKLSDYPLCPLCLENEGFYGAQNKAARSNHRLVRLELNNEKWGFQYSPYAYYNEHSIVLNEKHQPMKINQRTFENLFAFLEQFPHYMIGSNADLSIVGGSILTHDHYQAGRHEFPMMKAKLREEIKLKDFPEITAGIVNWPMSVLRLTSKNTKKLIEASQMILKNWQVYSDEKQEIIAQTPDGVRHHTITPIAYKHGEYYEINLVLRDNNTSEAYPDGIFHPHAELHHIKKENIGLIEVMGLAILPARLKNELKEVEKYVLNQPNTINEIHKNWADQLKATEIFTPTNVEKKIQAATGQVFVQVLQDAGVFKNTSTGKAAFTHFIDFLNK